MTKDDVISILFLWIMIVVGVLAIEYATGNFVEYSVNSIKGIKIILMDR